MIHVRRQGVRRLAAVACALAGCVLGSCATPGSSGRTDEPGLRGEVVAEDDTGFPDRPAGGGWIIAVPESRVRDLWRDLGLEGPNVNDLRYSGFPVDRTLIEKLKGAMVGVDENGSFVLDANGPHLVCRIPPENKGAFTQGCGVLDLPETGELDVRVGEGGFFVEVRG